MALQRCSAEPVTLAGLRAALGDPTILDGVHLLVTARAYSTRSLRRSRIDTIPVATHPNGIVEIVAVSGHYRYLLLGHGQARLTLRNSVTHVDVKDGVSANITVDQGRLVARIAAGKVTITRGTKPRDEALAVSGIVRYQQPAVVECSIPEVAVVEQHPPIGMRETLIALDVGLQREATESGTELIQQWGWVQRA